ncbi:MAG: SemiSWEET transporter [bacterium]|nr:SemiSWEET transporter [Candidatus Margulisiibacteriota bacterium]
MDYVVFLIGSLAAALTTISFLPQVIKAYQTKQTKDLSLVMYVVLSTGLVFWLIYGFCLNSLPIILANSITLMMALFLVFLKLKHG